MLTMNELPTLPADISHGAAGLWAANILMTATVERGWPVDEVADLLALLMAVTCAGRHSDDELHSVLQGKLDRIRAGRAVKS